MLTFKEDNLALALAYTLLAVEQKRKEDSQFRERFDEKQKLLNTDIEKAVGRIFKILIPSYVDLLETEDYLLEALQSVLYVVIEECRDNDELRDLVDSLGIWQTTAEDGADSMEDLLRLTVDL